MITDCKEINVTLSMLCTWVLKSFYFNIIVPYVVQSAKHSYRMNVNISRFMYDF